MSHRKPYMIPDEMAKWVRVEAALSDCNPSKIATRCLKIGSGFYAFWRHFVDDSGPLETYEQVKKEKVEEFFRKAIESSDPTALLAIAIFRVKSDPELLKEAKGNQEVSSFVNDFIEAWKAK